MIEILNVRQLPSGYEINGHIIVLPTDIDYPQVEKWVNDGKEVMPLKTQAELQQEVFTHFDRLTRQFIDDAVIAFDTVNNTTFRNIEAFTKYLYDVNDVRYPIAVSFLMWQSSVWDAVIVQRDAYIASGTAPTDADFIAALPAKI